MHVSYPGLDGLQLEKGLTWATWSSCSIDMPTAEPRRSSAMSCSSSPTGCLRSVSDWLSMKWRSSASCTVGCAPCDASILVHIHSYQHLAAATGRMGQTSALMTNKCHSVLCMQQSISMLSHGWSTQSENRPTGTMTPLSTRHTAHQGRAEPPGKRCTILSQRW